MMKRAVAYRHKVNGSGKKPNRKPTPADKRAAHEAGVRASAVSVMHLLLAQTARVHYPLHDVRTRTIFGIATLAQLQQELAAGRLTIDCSQAVTLIAHVAGERIPTAGTTGPTATPARCCTVARRSPSASRAPGISACSAPARAIMW